MHFERLRTCDDARYLRAMALYERSFPPHEQRQAASQAAILGNEAYQFNLIYDENALVGILLCWETEHFLYVEHFCIAPEKRGRRYGQRALELLHRRGKPVILEIDPPVDDVSTRRLSFYERAGYRANAYAHVHPPYRAGFDGHRLVVLSRPDALTEAAYNAFHRYLTQTVMGG